MPIISSVASDSDGLGPARHRDLRLDFFRGLALVFIFLDHIPSNLVSWITIRNYGFSNAAELFVFISGYTATITYRSAMKRAGFLLTAAHILRRCWQLYVAHIFLFTIFTAQIVYLATRFHHPIFIEEMQINHFLNETDVTLGQALLLKYRPANLDILPLYIVLLVSFPAVLWSMERNPGVTLMVSVLIYLSARTLHLNFASYPPGEGWFFNPLTWQLLFVLGAALGLYHRSAPPAVLRNPATFWLAVLYLVFACAVALSWQLPDGSAYMPIWLGKILYPISKTNLDPVRLLHFLALAYVTVCVVHEDTPFFKRRISQPLIRCGQHSLYVFCLSIVLSFSGHFLLVEISGGLLMQILVSAAGIALMVGLAYLLAWYRGAERKFSREQRG